MEVPYLVLEAVAMEMCCVYVYFTAHSHQVPVHLISHVNIQPMKVAIDQAIYTYNAYAVAGHCSSTVLINVSITSKCSLLIWY